MTNEEIKKRGEIYSQLIDFPPFQYLVEEMTKRCNGIADAIVNDNTIGNDNLFSKGIRVGILRVIDTPGNAIEEAEQLLNAENS